jgi:putative ABC transport system substrate-binding protein
MAHLMIGTWLSPADVIYLGPLQLDPVSQLRAAMNRRDFIRLFGGGLVGWPFAALAQQKGQLATVGAIMGFSPNYPLAQKEVKVFERALAELGWSEGRNIHLDYRWASSSEMPATAGALVASNPSVILANGSSVLAAVRAATSSIPIVFIGISDPEGVGVVANLARPGGNMTGVANFEPSMGGKWLQTLKEIAPRLTRVGVLRFDRTQARILQSVVTDGAAGRTDVVDCSILDEPGLRTAIGAFNGQNSAGLIVLPDPFFGTYRSTIFELAAKQRHPAIYPFRSFADDGGLISYGVDLLDQVRRCASYVDQILKGARPGDLPVQAPTKFEMVINLKTARALGLDVSPALLARADEVIE